MRTCFGYIRIYKPVTIPEHKSVIVTVHDVNGHGDNVSFKSTDSDKEVTIADVVRVKDMARDFAKFSGIEIVWS